MKEDLERTARGNESALRGVYLVNSVAVEYSVLVAAGCAGVSTGAVKGQVGRDNRTTKSIHHRIEYLSVP